MVINNNGRGYVPCPYCGTTIPLGELHNCSALKDKNEDEDLASYVEELVDYKLEERFDEYRFQEEVRRLLDRIAGTLNVLLIVASIALVILSLYYLRS